MQGSDTQEGLGDEFATSTVYFGGGKVCVGRTTDHPQERRETAGILAVVVVGYGVSLRGEEPPLTSIKGSASLLGGDATQEVHHNSVAREEVPGGQY